MKKIIYGKSYDTTTARYVGGFSANNGDGLYAWSETLYCKRTGEYFLHGEGGAGSKYARQSGSNEWSYGEEIRPLTYTEATSWAEQRLSAEQYEAEFGVVEEDDSRTAIHLYLPADLVERAQNAASRKGVTLAAYIEQMLANV